MTASALILADLRLSHSALSCLTALRADLASDHSNFPNMAVSILALATTLLPSSAPASCLATPHQAPTTAFLTASFCSLMLLQQVWRAI